MYFDKSIPQCLVYNHEKYDVSQHDIQKWIDEANKVKVELAEAVEYLKRVKVS
jgi:hypothetical protein